MTTDTQRMTHSDAADTLIQMAARFYERGWMMGTSGNLSLRLAQDSLEYVITASGRPKGSLSPEDMVYLGVSQSPLFPGQPSPSAETALHEMIYSRCPGAGAVFHVHTVAATALSMRCLESKLCFEGLEMLKGLGVTTHDTMITLPVVENTQDIEGLARSLASTLNPDVPGFLLRGHGLYTWGRDAQEALNRLECWDFLFQVSLAGG
jgi:methylthioribulose-1-phosphate dehydratase